MLRATPVLNAQLPPTAEALLRFGQNPNVVTGIDALRGTATILDPTLAFVTPSQTVCRYPSILLRNAAGTVSQGDGIGTWLRSITIFGEYGVDQPLRVELRVRALLGARQRPRGAEPPPLQPLPEHCRPGPDARVRGRQRPVPDGANGDRQRARQPGNDHRPPGGTADGTQARDAKYNETFFRGMGGPGPLAVGLFVVLLIVVGIYLAFAKSLPFTSPGYELKATFANAVRISDKAPVRIAGVNVGKVTGLERKGNASVVTFTVSRGGPADPRGRRGADPAADLPRGQLLPRRRPGQPERARAARPGRDPDHADLDRGPARRDPDRAADAPAGEPASCCSRASARRSPTRRRPATTPTPGSRRAGRDRRRRRSTRRFDTGGDAGRTSAIVNEALLGTEPDDLTKLLVGGEPGRRRTLVAREAQLQDLITNFNITTGALADESDEPLARRSGCWRRRWRRRGARWSTSTRRCRRCGRSRSRRGPGSPSCRRRSPPACPGSTRRSRCSRKRELGGDRRSCSPAARPTRRRRSRQTIAGCRS